MKIKILHLYPDLLNLYGDRGNIECMRKRLMWRGIDAEVVTYTCEDSGFDLSDVDIVFIGGGSDREQKIVCHRLLEHKDEIRNYVEDNGVLVAVCGGYQLLGKYYKLENETIEGLDILNIYTEQGKKRLIGNIVLENDFLNQKIVGFENHGGQTQEVKTPFGKVLYGNGNCCASEAEGYFEKNVIATYLHGPCLAKNPEISDYIINYCINRGEDVPVELAPLDDKLEKDCRNVMLERLLK